VPYNRLAQLGGRQLVEVNVRARTFGALASGSAGVMALTADRLFLSNVPWTDDNNFWLGGDPSRGSAGAFNDDNLVVLDREDGFAELEY